MSFGKRSPSPRPTATTPKGNSRLVAWGIAGAALLAVITGLYLQRVQLLLHIHPASLATIALPKNAVQLRDEWPLDAKALPLRAIKVINWSVEHMAALCADRDTYQRMQEIKGLRIFNDQSITLESAQNMYLSAKAATAQGMIDEIGKRRDEFCRNDYGVAIYDARIAASFYAERSSHNSLTVAQRYDEMIRLLKSINEKDQASHGRLTQLSDDEQRLEDCINKTPASDTKLLFRCYSASKGEDTMDEELDTVPEPPRPAPDPARAQEAYVSPDIDIRAHCREIHGNNYTIREVCERNEEEARAAIRSMWVPVEIARECDRIHDSYTIRQVCYRNQMTAKERLGG